MSESGEQNLATGTESIGLGEEQLDDLLRDPKIKESIIRKIGLGNQDQEGAGARQCLTPSGMSRGSWPSYPPAPFWPGPFPSFPVAGAGGPPPAWWEGRGDEGRWARAHAHSSSGEGSSSSDCRRDSEGGNPKRARMMEDEQSEEDVMEFLDDNEALELVEFDPSVEPTDTWEPPPAMSKFLDKHFNKALGDEEKEAIIKDFPKPNAKALMTPKLDEQVKDQLKKKGKSPHFGAEKSLFKIQDQILGVTGPLTCLWADLLNKDTRVSGEDTLLLVQRALVLLGNASHSITLERRKIAWTRINPKLKTLATEEYSEREANLFGPGFLEKASKRLEVEKTLAKVTNEGKPNQQGIKRPRYGYGNSRPGRFLSRGASVRSGNTRNRQPQPQSSYNQFRSRRYFQRETSSTLPKNRKPSLDKPDQ